MITETSLTFTRDELAALLDGLYPSEFRDRFAPRLRQAIADIDRRNAGHSSLVAQVKGLADEAKRLGMKWPTAYAWGAINYNERSYVDSEIDAYKPKGYPTFQRDSVTMGGPAEFNGWHQVDTVTNPGALRDMAVWLRNQIGDLRERKAVRA